MRGFIQIPLLIILLIGAGTGIYLIQQKTQFFPQVFSNIKALNIFLNQKTATTSAQPFTYQLPKSTAPINYSSNPILSAFEILLQRKTTTQSPSPKPTSIPPKPTTTPSSTTTTNPNPTFSPTPTPNPSSTPDQNNPSPTATPKSKPNCNILILPYSNGIAPYSASVCVGNNNPYLAVQQEFVDYEGDGSWDYQGPMYGCHSFTFQNPGTYYPKAKIVLISGDESDICQTTAVISSTNPTPTPTSMPLPSP